MYTLSTEEEREAGPLIILSWFKKVVVQIYLPLNRRQTFVILTGNTSRSFASRSTEMKGKNVRYIIIIYLDVMM